MIAVGKTGGQFITYSDRFAYTGMKGKGKLSEAVKKAATNVDGTDGPESEDTLADAADPRCDGRSRWRPIRTGIHNADGIDSLRAYATRAANQDHGDQHEAAVPYQQREDCQDEATDPESGYYPHAESDILYQECREHSTL
jgi:hypothetical protein